MEASSGLMVSYNGLPPAAHFERVAVAVSPDLPNLVYALYGEDSPTQGGWGYYELYMSTDYGYNWQFQSGDTSYLGNQTWYDLTLTVEPNYPYHVYMGGVPLFKSTNYGNGFTKIAIVAGLPDIHADVHDLLWSGSTLYAATDGGLSKSTDGGVSWTNLSDGLNIMQVYDMDYFNGNLMGGTQDNGTNTWNISASQAGFILGGDGFECHYDPNASYLWYASTQVHRYRWDAFDECPGNWCEISPPGHKDMWDASWIFHPQNSDTSYCAFFDLARTYDRGDTWDLIDPGFNNQATIRAMAQGVDIPNVLYCSDRLDIKLTTNLHDPTPTWYDISSGLPITGNQGLGGIAVDPSNANKVFATVMGYHPFAKVFYSTSAGLGGWIDHNGSLPNVPIRCIAYEPGSNDGVYIGTDIGVFYRNADMADWIWFSNGLPRTRIEDIQVKGGYLYVATYGRGIWRTPLYTSCPVAISLTPANDPSAPHTTGVQVYSASFSLLSNRIIAGGSGTDVTYKAGNYVRLDPGFTVKPHTVFEAKISGCPDD